MKELGETMKRIFLTILLMVGTLLGSQMIVSTASAQDIWLYTANDGTTYWVESETAVIRPKYAEPVKATVKTVRDNRCVDETRWIMSGDEGYIFAAPNGEKGFAVYAYPRHEGNEPVYNRPELLALWHWALPSNHHTK